MKNWKFWFGVLISAVFLYFTLRGLKFGEFWEVIKTANYIWLLPGIAVYFLGVWVRAWRWHYLLRPLKKIPTVTMFPVVTIGYFGNNILPARAGEVLRAFVLRKREGVPVSASLATIIVERIFDGVVMLAFVFINLPELAKLTGDAGFMGGLNIRDLAIIGTVVFVGALLIFLLAAMFPLVTERITVWLIDRLIPEKVRPKTLDLALRFLSGLEIFALSKRSADGLPDHHPHLAARDGQILVCDARFSLRSFFFHPDADEWNCQSGDHPAFRPGLCGHF